MQSGGILALQPFRSPSWMDRAAGSAILYKNWQLLNSIILYWIRNVINRTGRYHHGNFFNANMMNRDTDLPAPEYGRAKTSSSLNQGRSGRSGLYSSSPPFRIRSVPSLEQDHFIEAVSPVQWGQAAKIRNPTISCILCKIFEWISYHFAVFSPVEYFFNHHSQRYFLTKLL